jgi:phytoene synthase
MPHHARSFWFAARLFSAEERERIAALYAYCRRLDDTVDEARNPAEAWARLSAWLVASRTAYHGGASGDPLIDRVMREARAHDVPFGYAAELVEGMRMDLEHVGYETLDDLARDTHRVAGVVGMWMTELFGVSDEAVLQRAATLGHAMQLTNIVRDVGEDLDRGRIYLPRRMLNTFSITVGDLIDMRVSGPIPSRYGEHVAA